ncbi:unnamed protein product [Phyllotreta striolata]|nr:unnamed protein product [Phyllotreta striolata]
MTSIVIPHHSTKFDQPDNGTKDRSSYDHHTQTVEEPLNFKIFEDRLKTFINWPNQEVSKIDLAKAGFVYTGEDDIVICPLCKIEGYRWVSGDDPMADHRVWNPDCAFFRGNIEHDHSEGTSRSADTCGIFGVDELPNSTPESNKINNLQKLGVKTGKGPHNQDKITYESRLATFQNWPRSMKQRPSDLAEAGFYYTGIGDQTLCFHCGGGLKDWEENDNPWEQHALWFSKCVFVNLKKGKDFIEEVKNKADTELSIPSTSGLQKTKEEKSDNKSECVVENETKRESEATEKTLCKICFKNELGVVFLPCGHIVACVDCAAALKTCAVCRQPVEAAVRAFLS